MKQQPNEGPQSSLWAALKNTWRHPALRRSTGSRDCLIVGLGNPGEEYAGTRHNAGFMVLDRLAATSEVMFCALGDGEVLDWSICGKSVVLARPATFVNCSGLYVRYLLKRFKVSVDKLLVIHDDVALEIGQYKFKFGGGSVAHKGLVSVVERLGTSDFYRLRIGIGQPGRGESRVGWVLSRFDSDQLGVLDEVLQRCSTAATDFVRQGGVVAMNIHNRRPRERNTG